jgi:hypothetical protein
MPRLKYGSTQKENEILQTIKYFKEQRKMEWPQIADELNCRMFLTHDGKRWNGTLVWHLYKNRIKKRDEEINEIYSGRKGDVINK